MFYDSELGLRCPAYRIVAGRDSFRKYLDSITVFFLWYPVVGGKNLFVDIQYLTRLRSCQMVKRLQ